MREKKAQISMEYIIITGFVICAILIPGFLIMFSSTNTDVYGSLNKQKTVDLGKGLVNDAKQMYYLGLYSKKISQYEVPSNVDRIFILKITHNSTEYYYVGISMDDRKDPKVYTFLSDIPLTSDLTSAYAVRDNRLFPLVKECTQPSYACDFINFTGTTTLPGMKRFMIETRFSDGIIKSSIEPVLQ